MWIKLTKEFIRKTRIWNGAQARVIKIADLKAEDIIMNMFVETENEFARELLNKFEAMIVTAKTHPKQYVKNRDKNILEIVNYIRENNLYRAFMDLIYITTSLSNTRYEEVVIALNSEMMDVWMALFWEEDVYMYGMSSQGEIYTQSSYYGTWDYPLLEFRYLTQNNLIGQKKAKKMFDEIFTDERFRKERDEQVYSLMLFGMSPFINERTKAILPEKWWSGSRAIREEMLPRIWKDSSFYKDLLDKRKFMLDRSGVRVKLKNAGLFKEIVLMEQLTSDNELVVLYRITRSDGSGVGYYHIKDRFFNSGFNISDGKYIHKAIENIVLEVYADLVVGLDIDVKRIYGLKEVEDIEDIPDYKPTNLYVQYSLIKDEHEKREGETSRRRGFTQRAHERSFTLRKLREGQTASEEAKQRAQEMGYELGEGYTFVRSYKVGGRDRVREELE